MFFSPEEIDEYGFLVMGLSNPIPYEQRDEE
jgi:hypothetical protein